MTVYVRLGDQYLNKVDTNHKIPLTECYEHLKDIPKQKYISLIGDLDGKLLRATYKELYGDAATIVDLSGPVAHSCGLSSKTEWEKIFMDLYMLLNSETVVVLSNWSNFVRIVLFLRNKTGHIYFLKDNKVQLITDPSIVFAKHYQF
jgi:hypothetical protein